MLPDVRCCNSATVAMGMQDYDDGLTSTEQRMAACTDLTASFALHFCLTGINRRPSRTITGHYWYSVSGVHNTGTSLRQHLGRSAQVHWPKNALHCRQAHGHSAQVAITGFRTLET